MREPVAEPAPITDIATLVGAAALGSDAAFSSVLAADKQRLDHTAPAALRDLLTSVDILRMSASQGLDYTDGVAGLVWYFNEIGIAGSEDDVIAAITDKLTGAGFAVGPPPSEHWNHFFQREDSQLRHEVMIEGPEGWTGGDREAAGVSLLWRVASRDPLPAPTFAEVVTALPYLVDDRIDASIYKALADLHVTSVTSGGTWTRYYSLSITFAASDASHAEEIFTRVGDTLEDADFTESSTGAPDNLRLERRRTGSHAQVSRDGQRIGLHIQPES